MGVARWGVPTPKGAGVPHPQIYLIKDALCSMLLENFHNVVDSKVRRNLRKCGRNLYAVEDLTVDKVGQGSHNQKSWLCHWVGARPRYTVRARQWHSPIR